MNKFVLLFSINQSKEDNETRKIEIPIFRSLEFLDSFLFCRYLGYKLISTCKLFEK